MSVTDKLLELDPTLKRYNEGDWVGEYKENGSYSSFNDAGIECEVGEFLYTLIRLLKPDHVLETGTHVGVGAAYLCSGLKDNNKGYLDTIEFIPSLFEQATARMRRMGFAPKYVTNKFMDVKDYEPSYKYDLILLDTEPQTRFAELVKFERFLNPGGYVFIHDLHRHMGQVPNSEHGYAWPWGEIPAEMNDLVKLGKLRPFHFTNPRGLTGFYKVHPDDYEWPRK